MEKGILATLLVATLVATTPVAVYGQQDVLLINNGGEVQLLESKTDGITIRDFNIYSTDHSNGTDNSIYLELLMESALPIYTVFQIIDKDGITTSIDLKPVTPGFIIRNVRDLAPITSTPVKVGVLTADTFYTINIMLFKDEQHQIPFEYGYITTILQGSLNCYQRENQCLNDYKSYIRDNNIPSLPAGWKLDELDQNRPAWSYLNNEASLSQNIRSRIQREESVKPAIPPVQLQNVPSKLAFGDALNIGITGPFSVATAMLFHIDQESNTRLVSVDQASEGVKTSLNFPIPKAPQGNYQPGDYRIEITVVDKDGNKYSFSYKYTIAG